MPVIQANETVKYNINLTMFFNTQSFFCQETSISYFLFYFHYFWREDVFYSIDFLAVIKGPFDSSEE